MRNALGDRDDIVETLFLNMFFNGKLKAMPPKLLSDDRKNVVIRPLAYCREKDLARFADYKAFPIIPCNLCGSQENLQRVQIKKMLAEWEREIEVLLGKLRDKDERGRPKHVIANADESEPGTFKDRTLLENDPYALIESLAIAGHATGAEDADPHRGSGPRLPAGNLAPPRGLEVAQDVARPLEQLARHAGQARDVDAVGAVGSALDDLVEEDDLILPFANGHVEISDSVKRLGQIRQFVIVGGKEGAAIQPIVKVLDDRPR